MLRHKIIQLPIYILYLILLTSCTFSKKSVNAILGEATQVTVTLSNISNNNGNLLVFIHDNEYSYYNDDDSTDRTLTPFRMLKVAASEPTTQVKFEYIPEGKYVISAYHDEDADGGLDRMWFPFIGMPTENYGISNNTFSYFSKGSFEQGLIEITAPTTHVDIKLSSHLNKAFGK